MTVRVLRLTAKADKFLRAHTNRKGDVSFQVNHAILGTDLSKLKVEPRSKVPGSGREDFHNTSVTFEEGVYEKVAAAAKEHGVSATALVDAVIVHYFKPKKAGAKNVESDSSSGNESKRGSR